MTVPGNAGPVAVEGLSYIGFWRRVAASIIDSVLFGLIVYPILFAVYGVAGLTEPGFRPLEFLLCTVLPAFAIILLWRYKQATPGKMAVKARIVDANTGGTPSVGQLVGRYFGYILAALPFGLGLLWVAWDPRKQGWHDKLAGTVVVGRVHRGPEPVQFSTPNR